VFGLSGREFLAALQAAMIGRGSTPKARLLGLWDALEKLFAREDFYGSFPVRAAIAVRGEPGQPVQPAFVEHHRAVRRLLEELVCNLQQGNAPRLATQLDLLVQGAIAGAAIDQDPAAVRAARDLSLIALSVNGYPT
jgi:hypothetical protein